MKEELRDLLKGYYDRCKRFDVEPNFKDFLEEYLQVNTPF